jgi:hypothetical protein
MTGWAGKFLEIVNGFSNDDPEDFLQFSRILTREVSNNSMGDVLEDGSGSGEILNSNAVNINFSLPITTTTTTKTTEVIEAGTSVDSGKLSIPSIVLTTLLLIIVTGIAAVLLLVTIEQRRDRLQHQRNLTPNGKNDSIQNSIAVTYQLIAYFPQIIYCQV